MKRKMGMIAARKQKMYDRLNAEANRWGMTVEEGPVGLPQIIYLGDVIFGPALPDFITTWLQGYAAARAEDE